MFTSKRFGSCQKSKQILRLNVTALQAIIDQKEPQYLKKSQNNDNFYFKYICVVTMKFETDRESCMKTSLI